MKHLKEIIRLARVAEREKKLGQLQVALEHEEYKLIPGTRNSVRKDKPKTQTLTQHHWHVFAMPGGKGKELYSVNMDGSGHDGSSGVVISTKHADFFRSRGVPIGDNLTLESLDYEKMDREFYEWCVLDEDGNEVDFML